MSWGSPSERRLERGQAGRAASARGPQHSTIALGPQPSVFTLRLVADTLELRNKRGSGSSGLEESGPRGEGLGIELHLLLSALLPGPGHLALGTDPGSTFPSLSKFPGSSGGHASTLAPASAHTCTLSGDRVGPCNHLPPSAPVTWILLFIFNLL